MRALRGPPRAALRVLPMGADGRGSVKETRALTLFASDRTWQVRGRADRAFVALADRHYSRRRPGHGNPVGPVESLVLVTPDESAAWATTWTRFPDDGLTAWRCSIFRNEGTALSSDLIREAMAITAELWGGRFPCPDGWVTWVDAAKVASAHPGYCFKRAGWWLDKAYQPDRRRRTLIRLRAATA